jgi:hypothetical protein
MSVPSSLGMYNTILCRDEDFLKVYKQLIKKFPTVIKLKLSLKSSQKLAHGPHSDHFNLFHSFTSCAMVHFKITLQNFPIGPFP